MAHLAASPRRFTADEGLSNAQYPIVLHGATGHPQNEALLQWFAGVTPSSAISHAYSYPDTNVLTSAIVPKLRLHTATAIAGYWQTYPREAKVEVAVALDERLSLLSR